MGAISQSFSLPIMRDESNGPLYEWDKLHIGSCSTHPHTEVPCEHLRCREIESWLFVVKARTDGDVEEGKKGGREKDRQKDRERVLVDMVDTDTQKNSSFMLLLKRYPLKARPPLC